MTEAIWQELPWRAKVNRMLITEQWPNLILDNDKAEAKKFEREIIDILAARQKDEGKVKVAKLQKELKLKHNAVALSKNKLENVTFVDNAPKEVVEGERARLAAAEADVAKLEAEIEEATKN